jgi:hypothetical protein
MGVSRRSFLTGLAGVGTYVTVAATTPLRATQRKVADDSPATLPQFNVVKLNEFTPDLFRSLIGSTFQAADRGTKLTLRLVGVKLTKQPHGVPPNPAMFSLHFRYVSGAALPQGTYQFEHLQLGSFVMFVVPSAKVQKPTYTAVFNRT